MGISRELVRSVFTKRQSTKICESNVKSSTVDKRRWSSVRAYLCGDEIMSAVGEEDSLSVKSSEATVTQPLENEMPEKGSIRIKEPKRESFEEDQVEARDHKSKEMEKAASVDIQSEEMEEAAAIFIQSVFRSFLVRKQLKAIQSEVVTEELLRGKESPSRFSMGTSIEVQTGNSVDVVSIQEESTPSDKKMQQKQKPQMFKPKEDWDDSTFDSNTSKMKVQNRMEAMTRRERAMAYAFSQQLRLCSKRKQMKAEETETNMGWSWLERWMATRIPEGSSVEGQLTKQLGVVTDNTMRPIIRKKFPDLSFEEKESCGSNEVPVQMDRSQTPAPEGNEQFKPTENRVPARKPVSRGKSLPTNHGPRDHMKANKKDSSREAENDIKQRVKQVEGSKKENSLKELSSEPSVGDKADENSKSDP